VNSLFRHAIEAPQVAPIRNRQPKIVDGATMVIKQLLLHSKNWTNKILLKIETNGKYFELWGWS
jgi:shikimate 5-dehydrogenase